MHAHLKRLEAEGTAIEREGTVALLGFLSLATQLPPLRGGQMHHILAMLVLTHGLAPPVEKDRGKGLNAIYSISGTNATMWTWVEISSSRRIVVVRHKGGA